TPGTEKTFNIQRPTPNGLSLNVRCRMLSVECSPVHVKDRSEESKIPRCNSLPFNLRPIFCHPNALFRNVQGDMMTIKAMPLAEPTDTDLVFESLNGNRDAFRHIVE